MTESRNSRRTLQGIVSSSSAAKTITVRVERLVRIVVRPDLAEEIAS